MKDLKGQILEILNAKAAYPASYLMREKITSEIESLIEENYVEKEFALWLAVKSYEAFEQNEDNYTVWWVKDGFQYNLDELHQYWLENIKDK